MVEAIKQSYPQREIADASFRYQQEVEEGERIVVGVNRYQNPTTRSSRSCASTRRSSASRSTACRPCARAATARTSRRRSAALREAAAGDGNLMEPLLECARAHASEGEIVESLQQVFGSYTETPVF